MNQQPYSQGQWPQPPYNPVRPPQNGLTPPAPVKKGKGLKILLALMALLVAVGVVLHSTVFRVRSINIYGNVNLSAEEVVIQSGLAEGQNIFAIDKKMVEKNINANRYLKFQSLRRDYPDTVTLVVYERVPCAAFQSLGIQYTMDKTCMILEQTEYLTPMDGMIVVTGAQVDHALVGQTLALRDEDQLTACQGILYELETKGLMGAMSELNVSDLGNLYLVSVDGFSIRLGTYEQIGPKLISCMAVHKELVSRGYSGGTIDVSAPVYPTYIP